jgi:hypothetical protein
MLAQNIVPESLSYKRPSHSKGTIPGYHSVSSLGSTSTCIGMSGMSMMLTLVWKGICDISSS